MTTVKLKPRTTYLRQDGVVAHIQRRTRDGLFWYSIQGDWYDGQGRRVHWDMDGAYAPYVQDDWYGNLVSEATDQAWWEGVSA